MYSAVRLRGRAAMLVLAFLPAMIGWRASDAKAGGPAAFSEEAVSRGINYFIPPLPPLAVERFGCGVGFVDLDNDGDLDVVLLGGPGEAVGVYENNGAGTFTDRSAGSGIPALVRGSGVCAADYDADGDLDLFLCDFLGTNRLMRNNGNFAFTDVSVASGLADNNPSVGAAWGDYNGDGWLDLFVPNHIDEMNNVRPNRMYRNNKDGTFTEIGESAGVDHSMDPSFVVSFFDYDRDGDADLYLGNDKGSTTPITNHLFRNDGAGTYTNVTAASGTEADVDCMGLAVGDLDRNGYQDIYVTNIPYGNGNVLLTNDGDGTFTDATVAAGVGSMRIGWGTMFVDFDNDAWLELYVCNMAGENRFYNLDGNWPAADIAPDVAVNDGGTSFCLAKGDVDGDGDLDMLVQTMDATIRLYINHEGSQRNWIRFDLRGPGANHFAIGAQLDVRTGSVWQMDEVRSGTGYKSQDELTLHFGLDQAAVADEVIARWPGGAERRFFNLAANRRYTIYAPSQLGDYDRSGTVKDDDLAIFVEVLLGLDTDETHVLLSDFSGDFRADGDDVPGFVGRLIDP